MTKTIRNLINKNQDNDIRDKQEIGVDYFKKVVALTPDELKKHKDYLKNNLKKNFY